MEKLKTFEELHRTPQNGDIARSIDGSTTLLIRGDWIYDTDMPVYKCFCLHSEAQPSNIGTTNKIEAEVIYVNWYWINEK